MTMPRREFLASSAAVLGTLSAEEKPIPALIDTHTHFYDPTRPEGVPWPGKGSKLYRTVLPADYKKIARPLRVVGTVVVEASPWVEDNQWLLNVAAKDTYVLGVVGRLDLASEDFEKNLKRFARDPLYRGMRINHAEVTAGLKGALVKRCGLLVDHDLELDINGGPSMPADVALLAARVPKLRIVINHAANSRIDGKEPPKAWLDGMAAAAKHPNVFCKVSALVEQTERKPAPRDVDYYRPVLDALWSRFGEDRLVFGTNWPVSDAGAPLETVIGIVEDYFRAKGRAAAIKFFHDNSQRAYGWKKR